MQAGGPARPPPAYQKRLDPPVPAYRSPAADWQPDWVNRGNFLDEPSNSRAPRISVRTPVIPAPVIPAPVIPDTGVVHTGIPVTQGRVYEGQTGAPDILLPPRRSRPVCGARFLTPGVIALLLGSAFLLTCAGVYLLIHYMHEIRDDTDGMFLPVTTDPPAPTLFPLPTIHGRGLPDGLIQPSAAAASQTAMLSSNPRPIAEFDGAGTVGAD